MSSDEKLESPAEDTLADMTGDTEEENIEQVMTPEPDENAPNSTAELLEYYKLFFPEWKVSSTTELLKSLEQELGKEELARLHVIYGSIIERLIRQLDAHTMQSAFALEALKYLSDEVGEAYEYKPTDDASETDKPFILKNRTLSPENLAKTLKGSEVSGREARLLILGINRNVKKSYLYNSGLSIVLRAPSLSEINLVYNHISENLEDYGRMLGAIFFMYSDFKLKSIIWDFIRSLVIDSNLKKWDSGNRLRDNISIHDYHHLLLMILTLMFKDGYNYLFVCNNPKCKHQKDVVVDLNLLQLTDFGRIPHDQLKFLATSGGKALDPNNHLVKYRKAVLEEPVFTVGAYRIVRKVPTIGEYLTYGEAFNEELAMSISDMRDREGISQYLRFNYARVFEPWVARIEVLDKASKEVAFVVKGRDDIALVLEQIQNSEHDETFAKTMNKFIQTSNMTHVGYLAQPCPECNTLPDNLVKGYSSFDVQASFFTAAVRALVGRS